MRQITTDHQPPCPTISLAMGEKGALSRALNTFLSPVTHPALPVCVCVCVCVGVCVGVCVCPFPLRSLANTDHQPSCPTISLAMREKGALSRALNTFLSPVTHPALPVCTEDSLLSHIGYGL